jgi:hypothetical protein
MTVAGAPVAAQERSKASHVILIARMPETLSFAVNNGGPPDSFTDVSHPAGPQVVSSITTSWVLGKGRAGIVTWTYVKRQQAPVLLAFAAADGISGYGGRTSDGLLSFHLPTSSLVSSSRLDSLAITGSNRVATSTVSLSDSKDPAPAGQRPEDVYIGTMKIQLQALP